MLKVNIWHESIIIVTHRLKPTKDKVTPVKSVKKKYVVCGLASNEMIEKMSTKRKFQINKIHVQVILLTECTSFANL